MLIYVVQMSLTIKKKHVQKNIFLEVTLSMDQNYNFTICHPLNHSAERKTKLTKTKIWEDHVLLEYSLGFALK